MKLKFNSKLDFQLDAIDAVTGLFEGMPQKQSDFEVSIMGGSTIRSLTDMGVANQLPLEELQILGNLQRIQEKFKILKSSVLVDKEDEYLFPNFSVEMETGTGKTYVYLRTIFELNRKYGLKKFIIVVPSIAVREGVLTSINIMNEHFKGLYDNVTFDHFVYNSKDLSKVRQFASSNGIQIMIINIQAFQKDVGDVKDYQNLTDEELKKANVIHKEQDRLSGRRPIEFIQAVRPIVIIDEPQSVDNTAKAKRSIKTLNPIFCLRYSATHINSYHLLYKLDPIKAYDMKLVKRIEVSSIHSCDNPNDTYIRLDEIGYDKGSNIPKAKLTIHEDTNTGIRKKKIKVKLNSDISEKTTHSGYEGYIVEDICAEPGLEYIQFANGKSLQLFQEEGGMGDEILKTQISQTIEEHLKKELQFQNKGIKVLSLFFIDRVSNYRYYNEDGNPQKGKIALWFENSFKELSEKPIYKDIIPYPIEQIHDGYFSADRKKGRIVRLKDTTGKTALDEETYQLIMRDKERLLSIEEPLRFIFSHSALKEGWDNPNVFQICTLREMSTDRERRQTLGRGLRLPVNCNGERVSEEIVNRLTVIASESFEDYAKGLQMDIEKECNIKFGRIEPTAFADLITKPGSIELGQIESSKIWEALQKNGYLTNEGDITELFCPEIEGFQLILPPEYQSIGAIITDRMKKYIFKNRVVNSRDRRILKYNKRIELNEDFKHLWNKINKQTRYRVEFDTEDLINRAIKKIRNMERILPLQIFLDKTDLDITEAGVEGGNIIQAKNIEVNSYHFLPDILTYLQRETELTRFTLAEILKQSGRLKEFTVNPQSFMTKTSKLIQNALREIVIDGIKYEKIEGKYYEMRLFERYDLEEYLNRLYEVKNKNNLTPYNYIPFDSEVERAIAERLDSNENVKFFCKLPRWFVISTPLGDYNPDWAIVTENEKKLYLVRETKSTYDPLKRRENENLKIACGKAHFKTLDINFKVATTIHEVLSE